MFLFKKKYDLIFGVGEACSCSSTLRRGNLQIQSFPLDWLFGSTFLNRVKILCNDFENFIRLEDLEYKGNNGIPAHLCDIYKNNYNGLTFNHDFLSGSDLNTAINEVAEKYKRRANRLLSLAKNAKTILVVWIDSPGANWVKKDNADFKEGLNLLKNKFPNAKIDLIVFEWQQGLPFKKRIKEQLSDEITKYTFDYQFHHKKKVIADYVVDEKMLLKILNNLELNLSIKEKFDNYFFKRKKK